MKKLLLAPRLIAIFFVIVFGSTYAQAATYTWTNLTTNTLDWTVGANWTNSTPFVSGAANELRFFPDASATWRLTLGTQTVTNVPTTLAMNTLTLNGMGPNSTVGCSLIVGESTSTWTIGDGTTSLVTLNASSGGGGDRFVNYIIAPNITLNQPTNTFTGNGGGILGVRFTGNITESAAGYGITKSGSHLLVFSGTNTYTGTTLVSLGTLRLSNATALPGGIGVSGGTSALTINGGALELACEDFQRNLGAGSAQFQITGGTSGFSAMGGPRLLTVNNDPALELVWGTNTFAPSTLVLNTATADNALWLANKIDLNKTNRTIQVNANTAVISGDIQTSSGTAGLTKSGNGTLVLTGTNTYNGNTTLSAGTLSVGATNNLGGAGAGITFGGGILRITGTALNSLTDIGHTVSFNSNTAVGFDIDDAANTFTVDQVLNQGSGTFTKSGAGTLVLNKTNTFTGATTLSAGTLVLDYGSGSDSSKLSATATLTLSGGNLVLRGGSHPQAVSATTVTANTGNTISRDGVGAASTIDLKAITLGGLSALNISEDSIAKTTSTTVNGILGVGGISVGSHFATKSGSDIVAYSGYTTYTNGPGGGNSTTVNQWTGGGTLSSGLLSYALRISNSGNSDVLNIGANSFTVVNGGTILYAGGGDNNFTINGTGRLTTQNGNQPLHVAIYAGTLTMSGILAAGGSSTLAKSGAGTLVAAGANDYGNPTYVEQGAFRLANNTAAGTTGGGIFVQAGAALELTNNITVGAEALTVSGAGISNGGSMRNCSGTNTYGGAITIAGGGARINSDSGTLKLTGGIVTSGGQNLTFGGAGGTIVSNSVVVGAGNLIKDGSGTLDIVVTDNTKQWLCGDMALNAGTLQFSFDAAPSASVPVIKVMGNLTFAGTPTIAIAVDKADISAGEAYPLLVVSGNAQTTVPTLEGSAGGLEWGGPGNKTLFLTTGAQGTLLMIQ
jgi:autotransporter-associated beta strand protein